VAAEGCPILPDNVDVVEQLSLHCFEDQDICVLDLIQLYSILVKTIVKNVKALRVAGTLELWLLHPRTLRRCLSTGWLGVMLGQLILIRIPLPILICRIRWIFELDHVSLSMVLATILTLVDIRHLWWSNNGLMCWPSQDLLLHRLSWLMNRLSRLLLWSCRHKAAQEWVWHLIILNDLHLLSLATPVGNLILNRLLLLNINLRNGLRLSVRCGHLILLLSRNLLVFKFFDALYDFDAMEPNFDA
jgi:hypothetical protein